MPAWFPLIGWRPEAPTPSRRRPDRPMTRIRRRFGGSPRRRRRGPGRARTRSARPRSVVEHGRDDRRPLAARSAARSPGSGGRASPARRSGAGSAGSSGCSRPAPSVARTVTTWSPGRASHSSTHCTQLSTLGTVPRRAACHGPSSTWTSTLLIPRCTAQATPATRHGPGRDLLGARDVDPAHGLDRRLLRPAPRHPVRDVVEGRQLEVHDPLGGADVAVETRDDEAHREAVGDGQRLAVHGDREQRVPPVHDRRHRRYRTSSRPPRC